MRTARAASDKGICLIALVDTSENGCSARCVEQSCSAWRRLPEDERKQTGRDGWCALLGPATLPRTGPAGRG